MALTKNIDERLFGNPRPGCVMFYAKFDWSAEEELRAAAVGDHIFAGKVKDGWVIMDSWYRMPTASTSLGTIDIGFGAAGQTDIAAAVDADGALTAWTHGTIKRDGGAELEITADEHLVITVDTAVVNDGVLEVMFEAMIAPGLDEPADANIDD
jgi:hypothetical protein